MIFISVRGRGRREERLRGDGGGEEGKQVCCGGGERFIWKKKGERRREMSANGMKLRQEGQTEMGVCDVKQEDWKEHEAKEKEVQRCGP